MSQEILIFDRKLLLQRRSNKVNSLSRADFLIKRSLDDILERLSEITREFPIILNLTSRNNYGFKQLTNRIGTKQLIVADFDVEEYLKLPAHSVDLIVSVLNLHSINDLPGCLIQLKNILKPNGLLIASMFGENNLLELREALLKTEIECCSGISPRMMPLIELKQLGMLLQRAGFNMPVIDSDRIKVHYKNPLDLLHDLSDMSETNIMLKRSKAYLGKKFWTKFSQNYLSSFSALDNQVIANFEILNLMAIAD